MPATDEDSDGQLVVIATAPAASVSVVTTVGIVDEGMPVELSQSIHEKVTS